MANGQTNSKNGYLTWRTLGAVVMMGAALAGGAVGLSAVTVGQAEYVEHKQLESERYVTLKEDLCEIKETLREIQKELRSK